MPSIEWVQPWFYVSPKAGACRSIADYSGVDFFTRARHSAIARCERGGHAVVFSGIPTLPTPLWRAVARQAGVHLYVDGDAVTEMAGSTLFVRCTGQHWTPYTQAHVAERAAGFKDVGACTVRLPEPLAVATAEGMVCTRCDRWQLPVNTSALYFLTD